MAILKKSKDSAYFDLFCEYSDFVCEAAEALSAMAEDLTDLKNKMESLHEIENRADKKQHQLVEMLNRSFITPIDQEDILALARAIDDITDAIDDVGCRFYIYGLTDLRPGVKEFIALFIKSARLLREAMDEFKCYKKSKKLHSLIVELNHCEGEGDNLYRRLMRDLFVETSDPVEIIRWRDIYEISEACCDLFEDAADILHTVIMKNS